jgi:hypothetical protein
MNIHIQVAMTPSPLEYGYRAKITPHRGFVLETNKLGRQAAGQSQTSTLPFGFGASTSSGNEINNLLYMFYV